MKRKPTDAELEVLQILWQHGPATVRFINDELNKKRPLGYTTTLKIMQIMAEKQILGREVSGRGHIYSPLVREQETQKVLLDRFLDKTFGGSALKLVMQALGNHKTSKQEISEIKDYLANLEGEKE